MVMFKGPIAFPITPFDARGDVDYAAVRTNAQMLARSGIASIVAPSGTGELFSLSPHEVQEITRVTVEAVAGKKPVVAAVGTFGILRHARASLPAFSIACSIRSASSSRRFFGRTTAVAPAAIAAVASPAFTAVLLGRVMPIRSHQAA